MHDRDKIVAIGLLTQRDLDMLGSGFRNAFPVAEGPMFDDLLKAIDFAATGSPRDAAEGSARRRPS